MRQTVPTARLPAIGEGKRGVGGHLGYLLRQAAAAHRLRMERVLVDLGVTPPQFSVLTMLAAYPGISNADIARLAMLTPPTVTVIVANLEAMGAVERTAHAVHGRIRHIDLTQSGRKLLAGCTARVKSVEATLEMGLETGDVAVLRTWLVTVAQSGLEGQADAAVPEAPRTSRVKPGATPRPRRPGA